MKPYYVESLERCYEKKIKDVRKFFDISDDFDIQDIGIYGERIVISACKRTYDTRKGMKVGCD
jgi:hypothetical protein